MCSSLHKGLNHYRLDLQINNQFKYLHLANYNMLQSLFYKLHLLFNKLSLQYYNNLETKPDRIKWF